MVTLRDSVLSLDLTIEWSSLRDLSGADPMEHSSIYMAKQWGPWMRSMCGPMIYFLNPIYIPSDKAPRLGVLARRGLGAFLVL